MKELNRKALIYSGIGLFAVIAVSFTTNLIAPESALGEGLRFLMPLLTGIIGGAVIFFRLQDESNIDFEELGEEE
jgi:hypothetical protein